MKFETPLLRGELIRRYKRFLADVDIGSEQPLTIHCPNTGSMKNCAVPGDTVWYSVSANQNRKYPHTWELSESARGYIGINTGRANKLVREGIESGVIRELQGYSTISTEVKYGAENSRIDVLLSDKDRPDCYVEVKSVTLLEAEYGEGAGFFPDSVSDRGAKHLRELMNVVMRGQRAVLLYCVQHTGIQVVYPASHIDRRYTDTLNEAIAHGVEVYAYGAGIAPDETVLHQALPFSLSVPF